MEQIGLTSKEVDALTERGKVNQIQGESGKSVKEIVFSNIFTYFNGIFCFLAVLVITAGSFKSLTFLPVVIANTLIGIFQQLRAKKVLDQLALLDVTKYTVIRDGKDTVVASDELVLGDVIRLESGQQVPADAVVVEGEAGVNESLLTGEADEVEKTEGSELMSGSFVTAGKLTARLTRVGEESYAARLTAKAKETKESQSEMIHDIELIVKCAGILIIPVGGALSYQAVYVNHLSYQDGITSMVSAVIGMIPEGLYLLVTIALVLSAARLALKKVLLHDMHSIETLARVDVLCVDKTGTITSDVMNVSEIFLPAELDVEGPDLAELCEAEPRQAEPSQAEPSQAEPSQAESAQVKLDRAESGQPEIVQAVLNQEKESQEESSKAQPNQPEPVDIELEQTETGESEERQEESEQEEFAQDELVRDELVQDESAQEELAQDESEQEESAQDEFVQDETAPELSPEEILAAYVSTVPDANVTMKAIRAYLPKAEPIKSQSVTPFSSQTKYSEVITSECTYRFGAPDYLLSEQSMERNKELIEKHAKEGQRVLALTKDGEPILFIALHNEIRENARETFEGFAEQGVKIKVISGDNPLTVSRVAAAAGIENADQYIDAGELETNEQYRSAVMQYTVFGRVKPEQKQSLVEALQYHKLKVAMTGDGVNDILAMKKADCSIAMGGGSDAARQAAQVVLLDSDFSHMKDIVSEGRRDINNITRSATLFLYKNIFSLLLATFSIFNAFTYPLQPMQVSLISMFNIGMPAMMLALEPNEKKQEGHFIRKTLMNALPASLTSFFAISAMVMFADLFDISASDVSIASTYLLSLVGFMILWRITRPMNAWRITVFGICFTGFLICNGFLYKILELDRFSFKALVLCVLFAIAEMTVMRELTNLITWLDHHWTQKKERKALY